MGPVSPPDFNPGKKISDDYLLSGRSLNQPLVNFSATAGILNIYCLRRIYRYKPPENRRGLPGFGQNWNDAIRKSWGGMPMKDIFCQPQTKWLQILLWDKNKLAAVRCKCRMDMPYFLARGQP